MKRISEGIWRETFDIVFDAEGKTDHEGFELSLAEAILYVKKYNGTDHSYFKQYKEGRVSVVSNETGILIHDEWVKETSKSICDGMTARFKSIIERIKN